MSSVSGSVEHDFEPPGKGPWELENTHFSRPVTAFAQAGFAEGFLKGFVEGTSRFGLLLDHLEPGYSRSFMYVQPVAFAAPKGAMGPPPKPVLQLLTRLHPAMRRRIARSAEAIERKLWREDLIKRWDEVDKPAAIAKHRAIQAVDVENLSDEDLAQHLLVCAKHAADSAYLHHKYTIPASLPVGDFLAGAIAWTGRSSGELLGLLRGTSAISRGFAAVELEDAGMAISSSDSAREILSGPRGAREKLDGLVADPVAGPAVTDYLDAVRWRSVGYDVADDTAGEMPDMLVGALQAAVDGVGDFGDEDTSVATIRELVPEENRADFDARLAEVRLMYRLRDERGAYSDGWATGLSRRALLETGGRLVTAGRLQAPEHAVELTADQAVALLRGQPGPSADEVAERQQWRLSNTTDDAPPFLRAMPAPPPPLEWLPKPAHRSVRAMNIFLENLFSVPETTNTDTVLNGLPVNTGVYEGTARLVSSASGFERIQPGDVLVTRMTSPYFNVVLPLLGAIVTDRGGQL